MPRKRGRPEGSTIVAAKAKKRRLAEILVEMEAGLYNYADGTPPVTLEGKPRVNKMQALRDSGYSECYAEKIRGAIFHDEYFLEQKALIEHERRGGLMKAMMGMQERTGVFSGIADRMALLLHERLSDPLWVQRIKTEDLFKYALQYHKLDLELSGALSQGKENKLAVVFMDAEERLPKESRDKMRGAMERFRAQRAGELEQYSRVGDALDDTIDGEAVEAD
jgi:hypothetical protein